MKAVLLLSYASLQSIDDVPAFYTHLFHGKTPPPEMMMEAMSRFRSIGTADPLGSVTSRLTAALENRLSHYLNEEIRVYQGAKHSSPFVEETTRQIVADGVARLYTFPMSPLYSRTGTAAYHLRVRKTLTALEADIPVEEINHWHLHPEVVRVLGGRLRTALHWISAANRPHTTVLFTAHSQPGLPAANTEFIAAFHEMAAAVAAAANWECWQVAYRSAGTPPQKWLGPDVLDVIKDIAHKGGKAVVVCDLLSLIENIEAIFDCRINSQKQALACGLEFAATEFLNDAADNVDALVHCMAERMN